MTALIVPCPHCSQASRLDSDRLPDQPAYFACPSCKQKVVVDKRQLLSQQSSQAAPPPAPPAASAAPDPPAASAAPDPPPSTAAPVAVESTAPADRRFPKLPDDAAFPSGIILGEDDAVVGQVQQMLSALGSETERVSSPDAARQMIINEQPDLCIYVGGQIPAPPYAALAPLTGLPPNFRRRLYLVLIADNLKTLDGNSAFLYQVNLILAKQDFPQLAAALYSGIDYHEHLYKPYFLATENLD
jgi:hypothetical protein